MLSKVERAAQWRRNFEDQRTSGLTVTGWCREHGIEKNTFYGWRRRLAEDPACGLPQFLCLSEQPEPSGSPLTVRAGRISIEVARGFDPELLSDVLRVACAQC
jgi:hypothetical protein